MAEGAVLVRGGIAGRSSRCPSPRPRIGACDRGCSGAKGAIGWPRGVP